MNPSAVDKRKAAAQKRDVKLNMRLPEETRDLIDTAATALGKTRTEFVVESAKEHAVDILLDRHLLMLDPEAHDAFLAALDNPPAPNAKLGVLLKRKAPWEKA